MLPSLRKPKSRVHTVVSASLPPSPRSSRPRVSIGHILAILPPCSHFRPPLGNYPPPPPPPHTNYLEPVLRPDPQGSRRPWSIPPITFACTLDALGFATHTKILGRRSVHFQTYKELSRTEIVTHVRSGCN